MDIISSSVISFGINILTNLSVSVKDFASNKIKQKKILHLLSDFNSNYENSVLDTKTFADILRSDVFSEDIYNYIFKNTSTSLTKNQFIAKKSSEIFDEINDTNQSHGRQEFKDKGIVISYLTELIDLLTDFRNDYFSVDELSLISNISNLIVENRELIIEEVKEQFKLNQMDNRFAEDIINKLITYNLKFEFELADELYIQLTNNKDQISTSQLLKVFVEYSKTCAYRNDYKKLSEIIDQVNTLPNSEKYINEINYIKFLRLNDIDSLNECLKYFKTQNYSNEILALRNCEVQISIGNINQIKKEILDQENNLKINFLDFPEAHFYRGLYLSIIEGLVNISDFATAYKLENSILYDFYNVLLTIKIHLYNKQFDNIERVYNDIFKFEKYLDYLTKQEQLNYWIIYLHLDTQFKLNKLDIIESNLTHNDFYNIPILKDALAEAYARNNNYSKALEILESIFPKTDDIQILLFNVLYYLELWDRIITEYEKLESLTDQPDIKLIYLFSKSMNKNLNETLDEIIYLCKETKSFSCYFKVIHFYINHSPEDFSSLLISLEDDICALEIDQQTYLIDEIFQNNYLIEARKIILSLPSINDRLISILLSTLPLNEENLNQLKEYKATIDNLVTEYTSNIELIIFSIQLDLSLKTVTGDTFKNISYLKKLDVDSLIIAYFRLSAKYIVEDFTEVEEDIRILSLSNKPQDRFLAAIMLVYTNQIESGDKLAIETIYANVDNIDDHLSKSFVSLINSQLGSVHDSAVYATIETPNIVIKLKNSNEIISIAIIEESLLKVHDNQYFFDAFHLNSNSTTAIRLAAKYKINRNFNFNEVEYELEEIITLKTHLYRYFLDSLIKNSSNHYIEVFSGENPEELFKQMHQKLSDSQKNNQLLLKSYNFFENVAGLPISALTQNKNNLSDYENAFSYLLNYPDQYLFVPYTDYSTSDEYVLSMSSLLTLSKLNLFKELRSIKSKLSVPKYIFDRINNIISRLSSEKDGAKGILNLYEDKIYSQMRNLEDIQKELDNWLTILEFIETISIEECELISDPLLNTFNDFMINEDKFSINLAYKNQRCLIVDDLFISRTLPFTKYNNFNVNSTYGMIYNEKLLGLNHLFDFTNDLIDKKYFPTLTPNMLYQLTINIFSNQSNIEKHFSKLYSLIRTKLYSDANYDEIIKEFVDLLFKAERYEELNHLFMK